MRKRLLITFLINIIITGGEIVGGLFSGSLSLLSDAVHNLTDAASALIGYIAVILGDKENSKNYTFGLKRAEILASFVNSLLLVVISVFMVFEAVKRILHPEPLIANIMLFSAGFAFVGNMLSVLFLHRHSKKSLNVRSVYLHMFADSLASFSLIVGALIIKRYKFYVIDPVLTIMISGYILHEALDILKKSSHILLEGSPEGVDIYKIKEEFEKLPEVKNIHHLHVWSLKDGVYLAEMHAEIDDSKVSQTREIMEKIKQKALLFGIKHVTVQFEVNFCSDKQLVVNGLEE